MGEAYFIDDKEMTTNSVKAFEFEQFFVLSAYFGDFCFEFTNTINVNAGTFKVKY